MLKNATVWLRQLSLTDLEDIDDSSMLGTLLSLMVLGVGFVLKSLNSTKFMDQIQRLHHDDSVYTTTSIGLMLREHACSRH